MINKDSLQSVYQEIRGKIEERISEFEAIRARSDDREFQAELFYCLLTPQSRATYCWEATCRIMALPCRAQGEESVLECLSRVRFKYTKAKRIVQTALFLEKQGQSLPGILKGFTDSRIARTWVVMTFQGIGWKEGSHFLRNTGIGLDLAIIDRHIIRMLVQVGILEEVPQTITYQRYLQIEDRIRDYAEELGILVSHLDLLFWYIQTGSIYK